MVGYLRSDWIRTVIQEFMSPSFRTENMLQFEALLMVGFDRGGGPGAPQADCGSRCGSCSSRTWRWPASATFRCT